MSETNLAISRQNFRQMELGGRLLSIRWDCGVKWSRRGSGLID